MTKPAIQDSPPTLGRIDGDGESHAVYENGSTPLPLGAIGFGVIDRRGRPGLVLVLPPGVYATTGGTSALAAARARHGQRFVLSDGAHRSALQFVAQAMPQRAGDVGRTECELCRSPLRVDDQVWTCVDCATTSCAECAAIGQCLAIDCGAVRTQEPS